MYQQFLYSKQKIKKLNNMLIPTLYMHILMRNKTLLNLKNCEIAKAQQCILKEIMNFSTVKLEY